jgi:hypothetical protein
MPVFREHLGLEPEQTALAGGGREVLEQDGPQPPALMPVFDDEGHLGDPRVVDAVVAPDPDELVAEQGDERDPAHEVDVGEVLQLGRSEPRMLGEEAEVDRLHGQPGDEAAPALRVRRDDRTNMGGAAVGEHHVGFPVRRVSADSSRLQLNWLIGVLTPLASVYSDGPSKVQPRTAPCRAGSSR